MFSNKRIRSSTSSSSDNIHRFYDLLQKVDTVIIGAGAGLSTAAGFTYSGNRFEENFSDFIEKYGFKDMYSGGFYPFASQEEYWPIGPDMFLSIGIRIWITAHTNGFLSL